MTDHHIPLDAVRNSIRYAVGASERRRCIHEAYRQAGATDQVKLVQRALEAGVICGVYSLSARVFSTNQGQ